MRLMREHLGALVLVAVIVSLGVTGAAVADADVELLSSKLTVVATSAGPASYNIVVEPYSDPARLFGFRVRPPVGESSGPITTGDLSQCLGNPVVNDVVCSGTRNHLAIDFSARGGNDDVVVRESQTGADFRGTCGNRANPVQGGLDFGLTVSADLGNGDDFFRVHPQPASWCPSGRAAVGYARALVVTSVLVLGGKGADELRGFLGNDTLQAGSGNDDVEGGGGNDAIDLGAGDDEGVGGTGNDTVQGGTADDTIRGDDGDDTLIGSTGDDVIDGGLGNDTIQGNAGNDQLRGGPGSDSVTGHAGDDLIWTDDDPPRVVPIPNEAACNDGYDTAYVGPDDNTIQCERVFRHYPGDGLPAYATETSISVNAARQTALEVRCPPQAGVRCTGTLRITPVGSSTVLLQQSYDLAVGQAITYGGTLSAAPPATVVARTVEQGQTGERSSLVTIAVEQ